MEFLSQYGLFLIKTATLVIAILLVFGGIIALASKGKNKEKITIKSLNEKYEEMANTLHKTICNKEEWKTRVKTEKKSAKLTSRKKKKKVFVINFNGDMRATQVYELSQEISAILTVAHPSDEVVIRLESPGGVVHGYGLAAAELERIKQHKLLLTIIIDKVAASGGYMMACLADHLYCAPFAIIGSIGVVAQLPNFHRFLQRNHIDFEQLTAGEYKRTLTLLGENTPEGRAKLQEQIEEIHVLFKNFIHQHRPIVDINQVATGEHWYGQRALELKLVDKLTTSEEYLLQTREMCDLYEIRYCKKKNFSEKLSATANFLMKKEIDNFY